MNGKSFGRIVMILLLTVNLVITIALVVVFVPRASAATGCFPDTNGHWAEEFICWMKDNGIVGGYPDGTFKPENNVTRAELSVITKNNYDLAEANDDDTLGDLSCSMDQIAKWDGSQWVCASAPDVTALEARVAALEAKLAAVTVSGDEVYFTGVNVHVRDGTGNTDGTVNGLGNLIIGYNEDNGNDATRTGSHNLVVGPEHSYTDYGGLLAGYGNTISGSYASVTGGYMNTASSHYSSVSGGRYNEASDSYASVSGGEYNTADAASSSVSGGRSNVTSGQFSSISGGRENTASGYAASVNGGRNNEASGGYASVCGGIYNTASGGSSTVLGGGGDEASEGNQAFAYYSVVVGGRSNLAGDLAGGDRWVGEASAVLAGFSNEALEDYASVSGGYGNTASGSYSSVSGGKENTASGAQSTVGGGYNRSVSGENDWAAGSLFEPN